MLLTSRHPLTVLGSVRSPEILLDEWTLRPTKLASAFELAGAAIRVDGEPWRVVSVLTSSPGPHFDRFPDFVLLTPSGELVLWKGSETPFIQPNGTRLHLRQGYLGVSVKGDIYFSGFDVSLDDGRVGTLGRTAELLTQDDPFCPDVVGVQRAEGTMALDCRQTQACSDTNGFCRQTENPTGVFHCTCMSV